MELEVFVYGVLCMVYFGCCLLFGYINCCDFNQGICINVCCWEYKVVEGCEDELGNVVVWELILGCGVLIEQVFFFEEGNCFGELMVVFEDEYGIYIMNFKDFCVVQYVEWLVWIGVYLLKIEGCIKFYYYVVCIVQVYCQVIDDVVVGKLFDCGLMDILEFFVYCGYIEGFLCCYVYDEYQNYQYGYLLFECQQFVGEFIGECCDGLVEVEVKNCFQCGDSVELMIL